MAVVVPPGPQQKMTLADADASTSCAAKSGLSSMGRTACGVRGMRLGEGARVISLIVPEPGTILTVTENGFGKRTPIDQFPVKGRAGMGVISIKTSDRNGEQVGAVLVQESDEIMLITDGGTLVRTPVEHVSVLNRGTQGVTLIRLSKGEKLTGIDRIVADDGDEGDGDVD